MVQRPGEEEPEITDRLQLERLPRSQGGSPSNRSRPPVRQWSADGEEVGPSSAASRRSDRRRSTHRKKPVYFRARDSILFEPLVAIAVIVILVVGAYAYTHNWPPVYIVESNSMQHGPNDMLGIINTGDIVFARQIPTSSIVTYVDALHPGTGQSGFSTYGAYGDVVIYHPNGDGGTPIVHRAILYLEYDAANGSFSAPTLAGLPCGSAPNAIFSYGPPGNPDDCQWSGLTANLHLYHIGWKSANVTISLSSPTVGTHSGFLTMGDDNCDTSTGRCYSCNPSVPCIGEPDQGPIGLSTLVEPGWVIGVARGMIPWFGSLKLLLSDTSSEVPVQSWEYMGFTLIGVVLAAVALHLGLEAYSSPDSTPASRGSRAVDGEEDPDEDERAQRRAERRRRRSTRSEEPEEEEREEDEEEDPKPRRMARARVRPPRGGATRRPKDTPAKAEPHRRGRPPPAIHRREKGPSDDENDL